MQINAIYDSGRLIFDIPVRLRHTRVPVKVIIPDEEVEPERDINRKQEAIQLIQTQEVQDMIETLRKIRGKRYQYKDDGRTDRERFAEELKKHYCSSFGRN